MTKNHSTLASFTEASEIVREPNPKNFGISIEQSTGNRKTWARIPAQSKASFFPQKDFQIL